MNDVISITFQNKSLRTINHEGNTLFVLKDLLDAMDSSTSTTYASEGISDIFGPDHVLLLNIPDRIGREQETLVTTEAGVTYTIAQSKTPLGKALNKFIHIEVIPAIREYGAYIPNMTESEKEYLKLRKQRDTVIEALLTETLRSKIKS